MKIFLYIQEIYMNSYFNQNNKYYEYLGDSDTTNRIWINQYRGAIVKSVYDPKTNSIYQNYIPYSHPHYYNQQIEDYFIYKLR